MTALSKIYNLNVKNKNLKEKSDLIVSLNNEKVLSYYKDDVWCLSKKLMLNNSAKMKEINFKAKRINHVALDFYPYLYEGLKDVVYKMIVGGEKSQTVYHKTNQIINFFNYIVCELEKDDINSLTKAEIEGYFHYLKVQKKQYTKSVILSYLNAVKMFFNYRNELNYKIEFEPFVSVTASSLSSHNNCEQKEVIDDSVWKQITSSCEEIIDDFLNNYKEEKEIIEHYCLKIEKGMKLKARDISHKSQYFKSNYASINEHKEKLEEIQFYSAILIQAYTGMRYSELLSLKNDCIIKEKYKTDTIETSILKIKGITFKYEDALSIDVSEGKEAEWYCPEILLKIIKSLSLISKYTSTVLLHHLKEYGFEEDFKIYHGSLFISVKKPVAYLKNKRPSFHRFDLRYQEKISELGIKSNFKITSHSFRRTFARMLARSLMKVEVDLIKEQFKHFSKDITLYYMRESEKSDSDFSEMIEGYLEAKDIGDTHKAKVLYEKMDESIQNAIMTSNNFEDLELYMAGRQLKVVNEYSSTINDKSASMSPIECLTCEGTIILPELHKQYWDELYTMYEELIKLEPNSIRFIQEKNMIKNVINKLENREAYISGEQ